jgi:hypothetical protein
MLLERPSALLFSSEQKEESLELGSIKILVSWLFDSVFRHKAGWFFSGCPGRARRWTMRGHWPCWKAERTGQETLRW